MGEVIARENVAFFSIYFREMNVSSTEGGGNSRLRMWRQFLFPPSLGVWAKMGRGAVNPWEGGKNWNDILSLSRAVDLPTKHTSNHEVSFNFEKETMESGKQKYVQECPRIIYSY